MFGSKCILCSNPEIVVYSDTNYLCPKCNELKKIIDIYSIDRINEVVKHVFIREEEAIKNRTKMILRSNEKSEKKV